MGINCYITRVLESNENADNQKDQKEKKIEDCLRMIFGKPI